jgi:glycosyltransferase involved in cell wall biosynthesis
MGEPPIRLLMTADAVGGVWQYSTDLARGLAPLGIETLLVVLGPAADEAQRQPMDGIPGIRLVDTGLPLDWLSEAQSTRAAAAEIAAIARRERVDLVHLNSPALAAEQAFPAPVLGVAHGCLATWWQAARPGQPLDAAFRWHEEMMARGLRGCDRVIAPSTAYAEMVRRRYRMPSAPHVVHNGRALPAIAGAAPQRDCAFTAGRLWDEVKNTRTLDDAAALLPFPLHAAGPTVAPHGDSVTAEHLHLLGRLDSAELFRWLARRPVFVSAATFEPFGLAVLEAAAAGCALVLSDIATFRELWDGAAVFVPPHDAQGFAAAIQECVEDLPLRAMLGDAARARAQHYSAERMARRTAAHYRELLNARVAA